MNRDVLRNGCCIHSVRAVGGERRPRASVPVSKLSNTSPWYLSRAQERLRLRGSGHSVAQTGIATVKRKVAERCGRAERSSESLRTEHRHQRANTVGVRRFRNMRSCSVNPPGGTMFTLKSAFGFRDLIYEGLGAEAGWKPTCRKCETTRARRPSL